MLAHARPDRRSGGLHAALRPRPRGRARARRRGGGAGHQPLPLRPGARGSRATRSTSSSTGAAHGPGSAPGAAACCAPPSTSRTCCATGGVAEEADLVHYQWLPIPALDRRLLPPKRPRVFTMHWRLPETGTRHRRRRSRRLLAEMDAVVVHSEHGAGRLGLDFGVPARPARVIPHGAFDYLTRQPDEPPLPEELRAVEGPVILAFGLVRPYKGTDVLLEAFARIEGAELWIVGMPRMPMDALRDAGRAGARAPSASSTASSPTPRSPPSCAAPTSSCCPTGTSSSRASSTRRSPSAARWSCARRRLPRGRRAGRRAARAAGDPEALADAISELLADPAAPRALAAAAAARRRDGPLLLGRDRAQRPLAPLRDALLPSTADNPR